MDVAEEIGLKPIEDRDWLEIDELFNQEIQDKLTLIEEEEVKSLCPIKTL